MGIVLIAFPKGSIQVICAVLGAVLLVSGIANLVSYLSNRTVSLFQFGLLTGIVFVGIGLWLLINPAFFLSFFQIVLGIVILVHGIADVQEAFTLKKFEYENWWVALVIGIVTAMLGLLIIVNPFGTTLVMTVLFGVALVLDGGSDLWIASRIAKAGKAMEQDALTADFEDKDV